MCELDQPGSVKVIFSQRRDAYDHTFAYGQILKHQSRARTTFLQKRTISCQVVDRRLMEKLPHGSDAGLQLTSFYQAVDTSPPTKWDPINAKCCRIAWRQKIISIAIAESLQPTAVRQALPVLATACPRVPRSA
jgi:hypothetical protein